MAMTPEGKVKNAVKKTLDSYGAYYFMPIGGPYARMGVPDVVGSYKGKFFAIECKAGKGKPTMLQERELRIINESGARAIVVNENNLDDVSKMLESL
jgi:Holliday junction resolvase